MAINGKFNNGKFVEEIINSIGKEDSFSRIKRLVQSTPTELTDNDLTNIQSVLPTVFEKYCKKKNSAIIAIAIGIIFAFVLLLAIIFTKAIIPPPPTSTSTEQQTATLNPTETSTPVPTLTSTPTQIPDSAFLVKGPSQLPVEAPISGKMLFVNNFQANPVVSSNSAGTCNSEKGCPIKLGPSNDAETDGTLENAQQVSVLGIDESKNFYAVNKDGKIFWIYYEFLKTVVEKSELPIIRSTVSLEYSWASDVPLEEGVYTIYLLNENRKQSVSLQAIVTFEGMQNSLGSFNSPTSIEIGKVEASKIEWVYAGMLSLPQAEKISIKLNSDISIGEDFTPQLLLVKNSNENTSITEEFKLGKIELILNNSQMQITAKLSEKENITPVITKDTSAWNGDYTSFTTSQDGKLILTIPLPRFAQDTSIYIDNPLQNNGLSAPTFSLQGADDTLPLTLVDTGSSWQKLGILPANCNCQLQIDYALIAMKTVNIDALMFVTQ